MSGAQSSTCGACTYKLSPRTDKAASKLCLKEKHNKRTLKRTGPTLGWHCRAPAAQGPGGLLLDHSAAWSDGGATSRNQIIVMPDVLKACLLTLGNLKCFLPSVLSSYPLSIYRLYLYPLSFIYSINSIGQGLPVSEGLKHSEVAIHRCRS